MRLDDFQDLELSPEEQQDLQESIRLLRQAFAREEGPPLPDSLTGAALLHLLDGVEQDPAPEEEPAVQAQPGRPAGRLIFGLFPKKYAAVAAMLAVAVAVGAAYGRLPKTSLFGSASLADTVQPEPAGQTGARDYAEVLGAINARQLPHQPEEDAGEQFPEMLKQSLDREQPVVQENADADTLPDDWVEQDSGEYTADSGTDADTSARKPEPQTGAGDTDPEENAVLADMAEPPDAVEEEAQTEDPMDETDAGQQDEAATDPADQADAPPVENALPPEEEHPVAVGYASAPDALTAQVVDYAAAAGNDYRLELQQDDQGGSGYALNAYQAGTEQQLTSLPLDSQVEYRQLLSYGDTLVAVGDLTAYPEQYLQLDRTVDSTAAAGVDNRDICTEMSVLTLYTVSADAPQPQLVTSHYQAGVLVDAAVTDAGVLLTVTDKDLYQGEGVADYLTESIPVVYDGAAFQYLPSGSIYIDGTAALRDCYTVVSRCDLTTAPAFSTVAYLSDAPESVAVADSGVYLAQSAQQSGDASTRVLRFDAAQLLALTQSGRLEGTLFDQLFPMQNGYALAVTRQEDTGGGILTAEATVLDPSLAAVSHIQLELSPEWTDLYWDAENSCLVVYTPDSTVTVDLSDPLAPVTR